MHRDAFNTIWEIAADQFGYVTMRQAQAAGVSPMAVVMMERRQTLMRVSHGVYRLTQWSLDPLGEYMEASLWPVGVPGIISHQSALALYEISDVNPAKIHITVPSAYRTRREIPAVLRIHKADLPETDVASWEGIPVTSVERSIRDAHAAFLGNELVEGAIEDARRKWLLRPEVADGLLEELDIVVPR
jgi:predicted transcriptional regulator of viral defense system